MKTIIYSTHNFFRTFLEKSTTQNQELFFTDQGLNLETAKLANGFECVCLFTNDDANSQVIEELHKNGVKYITIRAAGYDNVDLEKCQELRIKVANVAKYSPYAVAEHAVTLTLCLNRNIKLSQKLITKNDFRLDQLIGFDMNTKTVGIIGTGKIGSVFANIINGFGCKILAYDVEENQELKNNLNIEYVTLDELCKNSDIISLHCPLNKSTEYLLDKEKFSIMKDGVFIINTARGKVINTQDLITALDNGKIGGAGLDVYEFEKDLFFQDHSNDKINDDLFNNLQNRDNVIITAHQAFLTAQALQNIADTTIYNIESFEKDQKSDNQLC